MRTISRAIRPWSSSSLAARNASRCRSATASPVSAHHLVIESIPVSRLRASPRRTCTIGARAAHRNTTLPSQSVRIERPGLSGHG